MPRHHVVGHVVGARQLTRMSRCRWRVAQWPWLGAAATSAAVAGHEAGGTVASALPVVVCGGYSW